MTIDVGCKWRMGIEIFSCTISLMALLSHWLTIRKLFGWPNLYCPRWAFSLQTTDQPQWCMSAFMMTNKWNWKPSCKQNSIWIARFLLLLVCFFLDICLHCIQWQRQRSVDDIRHPSAMEPLCESKNLNKMSACRLTGIYLRAAWPFTTLKYLS